MTLRIVALNDDHDLADFDSGTPQLDLWLRDHSRAARSQGTRTYVLVDDNHKVLGYFAIAPHLLRRDDAPGKLGRGAPREIPSILLAKLALGQPLKGRGLGAELLVRALRTIVAVARIAGGKMIVVDAIDTNSAAFYRKHDFEPLPNRPERLVMKLSTTARALGEKWP